MSTWTRRAFVALFWLILVFMGLGLLNRRDPGQVVAPEGVEKPR